MSSATVFVPIRTFLAKLVVVMLNDQKLKYKVVNIWLSQLENEIIYCICECVISIELHTLLQALMCISYIPNINEGASVPVCGQYSYYRYSFA